MQLKIEPIKIQLLLSIYFPDWFANWTSEPIGFWKDFMINQLKLMFKKKLFSILKRLKHLKMPLYETLYHKTGRRRRKNLPLPHLLPNPQQICSLCEYVAILFLFFLDYWIFHGTSNSPSKPLRRSTRPEWVMIIYHLKSRQIVLQIEDLKSHPNFKNSCSVQWSV